MKAVWKKQIDVITKLWQKPHDKLMEGIPELVFQ